MNVIQMRNVSFASCIALLVGAGHVAACSSSTSAASPEQDAGSDAATGAAAVTGYRLATAEGGPLTAVPGDGLQLVVLETLSDGTTAPLPSGATVTWSGPPVVTALAAGTEPDAGVLPERGDAPAALWLVNPGRAPDANGAGVLWVLDRGTATSPTVDVTAVVGGVTPAGVVSARIGVAPRGAALPKIGFGTGGAVTATISIGAPPAGDATAGKATFAANCATCHGATAHGKGDAPGLNAEDGNVAADPDWNAATLAFAARADVDDLGVSLDSEMPNWLTKKAANGKTLTAADFADIYAFLKTQTH